MRNRLFGVDQLWRSESVIGEEPMFGPTFVPSLIQKDARPRHLCEREEATVAVARMVPRRSPARGDQPK
jgi:hypothetical protein